MTPKELREKLSAPEALEQFKTKLGAQKQNGDLESYVKLLSIAPGEWEALYAWALELPTEEQKRTGAMLKAAEAAKDSAEAAKRSATSAAESGKFARAVSVLALIATVLSSGVALATLLFRK